MDDEYFFMAARDQRANNFVIKNHSTGLSPLYDGIACKKCRRVTWKQLRNTAVGPDFKPKVKKGTHFFYSTDNLPFASTEMVDVLRQLDNTIRFHSCSGGDFHLVLPTTAVNVDLSKTGTNHLGTCRECGRHSYNGPLSVESLCFKNKSQKSRMFCVEPIVAGMWIYCGADMKAATNSFSGTDFMRVRKMAELDRFK